MVSKKESSNRRSVALIVIVVLLWALLCFGKAADEWGRYTCMKNHYPDKFIEIVMENPNSEEDEVGAFDRGKAIYPRTYVHENIRYSTKINAEEFDDTFYICEDAPSREYSETDLRHAGERLAFAAVYMMLGVFSLLWAILQAARSIKGRNQR